MNAEQRGAEQNATGAPSGSRSAPSPARAGEPAAERPAGSTVLYDDEGKPIWEVEVPPDAERSVAARLEETARGAPPKERSLAGVVAPPFERTIELREEQLVPQKELRELGEVLVRTQVEEAPGRLEVEAYREEVEVEHEPAGEVVQERVPPWEENGALVVPVYEEQLVVVKRLVLRERLRIRRVATTERRLFEDTVRRERLVVEDPNSTGLVHERFATRLPSGEQVAGPALEQARPGAPSPDAATEPQEPPAPEAAEQREDVREDTHEDTREDTEEGGLLEKLVRRALQ